MNAEVAKAIKGRVEVIGEFEQLLKDLREAKIHIKKRPSDYNEPHYLIYEEEELHPIAEMYARIAPGDDQSVQVHLMGSPLEQRVRRFLEENIKDEEARRKLTACIKTCIPAPPEEKKIKDYFEKEAKKFKRIKLEVYE